MNSSNPLKTIHELKGCALSIVCILSVLRRATPALELARYSGYDADTVTKALRKLEDPVMFGFVLRTSQGWSLADGAQQLPLAWLMPESENFGFGATTTSTTIEETNSEQVEVVQVNPRISDSLALLVDLGVGRPMAKKLAALYWATPEYIQAHASRMDLPDDIGLLITRIRDEDPAPKAKTAAHGSSVTDKVSEFLGRTK